jgi:hypothetical protein
MKKTTRCNPQENHKNNHLMPILLLTILSANLVSADEKKTSTASYEEKTFVITATPPSVSIQSCQQGDCISTDLTQQILDSLNDGYTEISAEDLTLDGRPEIILTHIEEGSVNTCSEVYKYDTDENTLTSISGLQRQLCNYSIQKGHIVSSYRSGAKWHEDIYEIRNNDFILKISDSCIGCEHINRTLYNQNKKFGKLLVTDNPNYTLRTPISTKIISKKAKLYKKPTTNQPANMYLIKNDSVTLTDFASTESDEYWYEIKYTSKKGKEVNAWLQCNDIEFCEQY